MDGLSLMYFLHKAILSRGMQAAQFGNTLRLILWKLALDPSSKQ